MSSQIGYIIYLTNTTNKANIIHWSLIQYKRIISSVLLIKIYRMIHRLDIRVVIKTILEKIFGSTILLIFYTSMKSLYDCLVK